MQLIKCWGNLKNESAERQIVVRQIVERQIVELKNHNSAILLIHVWKPELFSGFIFN